MPFLSGAAPVGAIIDGGPEGDLLPGSESDDQIRGLDGDDSIHGLGGADEIRGDEGNDRLYGGAGRDTLYGGSGNDFLEGGAGNDRLFGDEGDDDFLISRYAGTGTHRAFGGTGDDRMVIFDYVSGHFNGGAGTDTLLLYWTYIGTAVSGSLATGFSAGTLHFTLAGVERLDITTDNFDDTITGGSRDDQISVLAGANTVDAGAGNDAVSYLAGQANQMQGGAGNDLLRTGWHSGGTGIGFVFDASGAVATDNFGSTLTGFERFRVAGGYYDDSLTGGVRGDVLEGISGSDTLSGLGGSDILRGGHDNDSLSGGTGNDRLLGGRGLDTLNGGAGADAFVFDGLPGPADAIEDFRAAEGDRLFIAAALTGGLIGTGALQTADLVYGAPGDSRPVFVLDSDGPDGPSRLSWDADGAGSGAAVLLAVLHGPPDLVAEDILLF